jgi:mono/diheme cytochrome c family protein
VTSDRGRVTNAPGRIAPSRHSSLATRHLLQIAVVGALAIAGCRQDMQNQPKYKDLRGSSFFDDQRSARPIPEDTVARGFLDADQRFTTGKENGKPIAALPVPLTRELLARGQQRFQIFCTPCHGMLGNGLGIVVQRGYRQPPSYDIDRLRAAPVGYFFDVMTHGFGAMPDYATQIPPADRWAIAAYVRALQLSQRTTMADVPPDARPALERPDAPPRPVPLPVDTDDWKGSLQIDKAFGPKAPEPTP